MSITFRCSACQARLSAADNKAGNSINCPKCNAVQFVPASSSEAITDRPPSTPILSTLPDPAPAPRFEPGPSAPAKPLPTRHVLLGAALAVLLCVGAAAIVLALGRPEERNADNGRNDDDRDRDNHNITPIGGGGDILAGGNDTPLIAPLDLNPPKDKPLPTPPDEAPTYRPADDNPKKKPDPPKIDLPPEGDPIPAPPVAGVVVKRRDREEPETLRKQFLAIPELHIDRVPQSSTRLALAGARFKTLNQKYPGPLALLGNRPDLGGLPMRMGHDCQLGKEPAENLQVLSRKLRILIQTAIPRDGIEVRPDPDTLKGLLIQGGDPIKAPAIAVRPGRFPALAIEGKPTDWLCSESVPALMQLLQAENTATRKVLVEVLGLIKGKAATEALTNRALMDLSPEVRELALKELKSRPVEDYAPALIKGLKYPWSVVADHAAEALATLDVKGAVPHVIKMLGEADPSLPVTVGKGPTAYLAQREVVRLNHLGNCVLCHAPSTDQADLVRGAVPTPGQPLPAPVTTPQYYERGTGIFVRADVTYLRQDFSVVQPVEKHGPWPEQQRFDYLVRYRPVSKEVLEQAQAKLAERKTSPHKEAMLFTLRELTGKDLGKSASDWSVLLPPEEQPKKP